MPRRSMHAVRREARTVARARIERWLIGRLLAESRAVEQRIEGSDMTGATRAMRRLVVVRDLLEVFMDGREK